MKPTKEGFVLSTGKEFYAYGNVLGIRETSIGDDDMQIEYGFDGTIWNQDSGNIEGFMKEELIEIGCYMIEQWTNFKRNIENQ